jgi:hypothetical protein
LERLAVHRRRLRKGSVTEVLALTVYRLKGVGTAFRDFGGQTGSEFVAETHEFSTDEYLSAFGRDALTRNG